MTFSVELYEEKGEFKISGLVGLCNSVQVPGKGYGTGTW